MKISLVEEFLLLALEDEGGQFSRIPETTFHCGIAGAALMDLELRGRIQASLERVSVADTAPTGLAMLDDLLAHIAAEPEPLHPKDWIARLMPRATQLRAEALDKLCERGILSREDHLFLWVLEERRYPVEHGEERMECKRRILGHLFDESEPDHHDVALVALADACGMFKHILNPATLAEAAPRIGRLRGLDSIGAEIARTAEAMNREIRAAERRIVIAGLAGNVMEWYDFGTYGYFAATIGKLFFPAHDPTVSLIASFAVFAVGFIGRPLGALIFGHIGDRAGRKRALMASVLMMALPTMFIGLMPTHAQIGIAAPILLVALRLLQGLAVGGEFTTSMVLLVEGAQRSRRGFVGSFASFGAVVLHVRRRLPPDRAIVAIAEARHSPVATAFRTQWRTILKIVGIIATLGIGFYLNFVYLSTWLVQYTHISRAEALALNCVGLALQLPLLPMAGVLCDRIGTKAVLLLSTVGFALFSWPVYLIVAQGSVVAVVFGQAVLALLQSGISAAVPAFMVEALPKHVRCTALSFGQNLAQACFGGTVPMVAVALVGATGYALAPAIYLAFAGVVSFLTVTITHVLAEDEPAELIIPEAVAA